MGQINLLDVAALTAGRVDRGLIRGQVGTVVERLGARIYEVEFSDDSGRIYAQLPLHAEQLMVLHYAAQAA
jgi:Domain of unknown function (DUF4926)